MKDYSAYLFVYFTGEYHENGEQVYFAVSKDGLHYGELNNNEPILLSSFPRGGIRDPFVIRGKDDEKFYIIATDLAIYKSRDWWEAQVNASQSIVVWESDDLVNWEEPRLVKVARDDAGCVWAPEAVYDKENDEFVVFWASRVKEDDYAKHRIYQSITKDFKTFTEPEVYIERPMDIIDTTIINRDGIYYRFSKDETDKNIICDYSTDIFGDYTHLSAPVVEGEMGVEGPQIFKFNNEDKYCLLLDNYGGVGYYPIITDDLSSGTFRKLDPSEYKMPKGSRHGSVIPITEEEYEALVEKYLIK